MTKKEIRESVSKLIKEFEGDDLSYLLMIIKESIEKKLKENGFGS